jgi:hypothetical protein
MPRRFIPVAVPLEVLEKKAEVAEKKATESPEGRHTAIEDALGDIYIRWVCPPKWLTG